MSEHAPTPLHRLGDLARRAGLEVDAAHADILIAGACALTPGAADRIAYAEGPARDQAAADSAAAAVIVTPAVAATIDRPVLVSDQPKLAFARLATAFEPARAPAGIHSSAVVDDQAVIAPTATIGALVVVGRGAVIEDDVELAAGVVVGEGVHIGRASRIGAHVSLARGVRVGMRVTIEAQAAIGGRGFGLAHNGQGWEAVPQLASVRIGDDVEIGAGTTIDRGALEDTVIGQGVKIDDQVHIGHNCVIGAHTVIAGCTGIAGSCTIGAHCVIGGGVGIGDHVRVVDGVMITGASQVPKDIDTPGVYSSTFRAMPARLWRKRLALFRQLDRIETRLRGVEKQSRDQ
ncbi:UDP-3-O-(3-hydroxymyristoyl)glucosamine N-acyltransferase [Salinisphaera sp. T31B1]|uniref:UDP-3-O-(3-hydroxymyristoyl)glucosamine N-acyltransferase n=1 Tax=Salinisphaera sp. T31B1 TaxID=727963 RepID=UPI003342ADE9